MAHPRSALVILATLAAASATALAAVENQWTYVPAPHPSTSAQFRGVTVQSAADAWAVGWQDPGPGPWKLLAMHWDGTSWTTAATPEPGVSSSSLYAIDVASDGTIWAAGSYQLPTPPFGVPKLHPLVMRNAGSSWEVMDAPTLQEGGSGALVTGMEFIADDDIWFVGDWSGSGLAVHWDGSNLERVDVPDINFGGSGTFGTGVGLTSASALGPDEVWAVGGAADGDLTGTSTIFRWNGSQWQHVPGPTPGAGHRLHDVAAIASDDVWAVGHADDIGPIVLRFNGSSWSETPITGFEGAGGELDAITVLAPDDIWLAGTYTVNPPPDVVRPLLLHWDGTTFTQFAGDAGGPFSGWFRDLGHADDGFVMAVGSGNMAEGPHAQIHTGDAPPPCRADVTGDGAVDVSDLVAIILAWGGNDAAADVDGSGTVDVADLVEVVLQWGAPCGQTGG